MSTSGTLIEEDGFGFVPRPDPTKSGHPYDIVRRYTMTNRHKASVQLISWGAGIQSIKVPNKSGVLGDVVLGFDSMDGYLKSRYIGSIVGRVVNRIANGKMQIDGTIHSLTINDKDRGNHFNGGFTGFDNVNWDSHVLNKQVVMSHLSGANSEGYPGDMLTQVKYSWTDDNQLRISIRAAATKATPANIASHCLLNLAGHGTGSRELEKHVVSINADSWTVTNVKENLPTGAIRSVEGTVYDLRLPTRLTRKRLFCVPGGGYNHNLCVTSPSCWCYRFHARILHPGSGRTLEVYSNQPGLQFYTGNELPDPLRVYPPDLEDYVESEDDLLSKLVKTVNYEEIEGKGGIRYQRHGGFLLSPQNYPNAVNIEDFPSSILYPGKTYVHDTTYRFGVL